MKILCYPEAVLREPARPLRKFTSGLHSRVKRMISLMREAHGVGLAANQVGWLERVAVVDLGEMSGGTRVLVNPVLVESEGQSVEEEGCLSFPGILGQLKRKRIVVVRALDLTGSPVEIRAEDLYARAIQHELDHLDGILIIDRMTPASRFAVARQLEAMEKKTD